MNQLSEQAMNLKAQASALSGGAMGRYGVMQRYEAAVQIARLLMFADVTEASAIIQQAMSIHAEMLNAESKNAER